MENKKYIFEGETKEAAIEKGLKELNVSRSDVEIKVISDGSSSLFGLFNKSVKVELTLRNTPQSNANSTTKDNNLNISSSTSNQNDKLTKANSDNVNDDHSFSQSENGFYRISVIDNGIYILVSPPSGKGKPVTYDKICEDFKRVGLKQFDSEAIKRAVKPENYGVPIKIGNAAILPSNFKLTKDSEVKVIIDKSKMIGYVLCEPPFNGGEDVTVEKIKKALDDAQIKVAPNIETINDIVKNKKYCEQIPVVFGKTPMQGTDGYIKWYFDTTSTKIQLEIDEHGNVDYKKILKINTVNANEFLGEKIDPIPGTDGYNIFNEILPAKKPKEAKMVKGKNVDITPDGYFFKSLINGQLIIKNDVPSVVPIFEVKGDVDYSVGNIEFNGTVIVNGTVLDGFSIKAEGNIEIKKTVGEVFLESNGNIILHGGFIGREKGKIIALGNIGAKFIQGGNVYAEGNIIVENNIMNSKITSGAQIVVKGKKGTIVGGNIFASEYIEAQFIGSQAGTKTLIETGIDIIKEKELINMEAQIKQIEENIKKFDISINTLTNLKNKNPQKFTEAQEEILKKSLLAKETLQTKLIELNEQKTTLCNEILTAQKGKVVALNMFFPGVTVIIKKHFKYVVKDVIKASAIGISDGDIRILPI